MTFIFHWIEWCFIWYWPSLFLCFVAVIAHKAFISSEFFGPSSISQVGAPIFNGFHSIALIVFIGFCLWVVICAARNGYGVG